MTPPIRTKRPERNYARLEQYRQRILCPGTWDALLSDSSPVGSPVDVAAFEGCQGDEPCS